jgi:hypothetical protein
MSLFNYLIFHLLRYRSRAGLVGIAVRCSWFALAVLGYRRCGTGGETQNVHQHEAALSQKL